MKNYTTNTTTQTKTQEISTLDLFICFQRIYNFEYLSFFSKNIDIINCSSKNIKNIIREMYKRLLIPFYIPLLILISFLLIISSKESANYKKIKFLTFFLGLITVILSETTIRFITANLNFNMKLVIIPFILILLFYFLLLFNFKSNNKN